MAEPTTTPGPNSPEDTNYLTVALVVGIPCSVIIVALIVLIFVMFYITCKAPSRNEEAIYRHRRFQGISLEQQRKAKAKYKKKRATERRESGVSGNFNPQVSRCPSAVSGARTNPFGLQEWQIRMYNEYGREGSPDIERADVSGEGITRRSSLPIAINPLVIQGQDHDPGYDTPPQRHSHKHLPSSHQQPSLNTDRPKAPQPQGGKNLKLEKSESELDSSSDDSMNPYD